MDTADPIDFRIPAPVVRRTFVQHASIILVALAILHIASGRGSLAQMLGAASLALAVLGLAYAFTAQRVSVTLSAAGLESMGLAGRRLVVPWSAPARIRRVRRSGYAGYAVVPVQFSHFIAVSAHTIFVPLILCKDAQFAAAVTSWSPPDHPLRDVVGDAAAGR